MVTYFVTTTVWLSDKKFNRSSICFFPWLVVVSSKIQVNPPSVACTSLQISFIIRSPNPSVTEYDALVWVMVISLAILELENIVANSCGVLSQDLIKSSLNAIENGKFDNWKTKQTVKSVTILAFISVFGASNGPWKLSRIKSKANKRLQQIYVCKYWDTLNCFTIIVRPNYYKNIYHQHTCRQQTINSTHNICCARMKTFYTKQY